MDYIKPNKVNGFHFWCQKVIPLVFDDSLSYYEVLCKLTEYMNQFSESLNETIDGLEQLQLYFDALNDKFDIVNEKVTKLNSYYQLRLAVTTQLLANEYKVLNPYESESLQESLNDMIDSNTIKPIFVTLYDADNNDTPQTCVILPDIKFIYNIQQAIIEDIEFNGVIWLKDSTLRTCYIRIPFDGYSISAGRIIGLSLTRFGYKDIEISGNGGLPILELDNFSLIDGSGMLTSEQKLAFQDILNTMIKNETVTPIIVTQKITTAGMYADGYSMVCVLNSDHEWLSNLLFGNPPQIRFRNIVDSKVDSYGSHIKRAEIGLNFDDYTYDSSTRELTITSNVYYHNDNRTYIAVDGGATDYIPVNSSDPATKGYVDSHAGGGSNVIELTIQDITNISNIDEYNAIKDALNKMIEDDKPYLISIHDESGTDWQPIKLYQIINFNGFKSGVETGGYSLNVELESIPFTNNTYMNFNGFTVYFDAEPGQGRVTSVTGTMYYGSNYNQLITSNNFDINLGNYVKTVKYESSLSFTYDSSVGRNILFACNLASNGMPNLNDNWVIASIHHVFYDETDYMYIDGEFSDNFKYMIPTNAQGGSLTGFYTLSGNDLTDGHVYHDVIFITYSKIVSTESVSWIN